MRFLLAQYRPAIRLYKAAWTLQQRGHEILVAHDARYAISSTHAWLSGLFPHVAVDGAAGIDRIASRADAIVHFNASFRIARGGQSRRGYTVFVGDLAGLREGDVRPHATEQEVIGAARGLAFVSDEQRDAAVELYGPLDVPTIVVRNGLIEPMLPKQKLPKLSSVDGKIHVVYSGTMAEDPGSPRDVVPLVDALVAETNVVVHLIPSALGVPDRVRERGGVVLHEPVESRALTEKLTQFDVGLVYVDPAFPRVRDTMRPNKLYEYLAAGIPVVANRGRALARYLDERNAGVVFEATGEIAGAVRRARELSEQPDWPPEPDTWESQAAALEGFFAGIAPPRRGLFAGYRRVGKRTS